MLYVGIFWLWIFGRTRSYWVIWLESGVYTSYEFCYNLNLYFPFSYFFHTLILSSVVYLAGFGRSWYWQPLKNTILAVFLVFCTVFGQYIGQKFDNILYFLDSTSDFDRFLESISDNLDRFCGQHNLDRFFGHHNLDICDGKVHFYIFVSMYLHIWTMQL